MNHIAPSVFLDMLERSGAEERLREGLRAGLASLTEEDVRWIVEEEIEDHFAEES